MNTSTEPKQAIEALDKLISELKPEGALLVEILYPRSFMKYKLEDMKGAKADLEACLKADPDSPLAEQIKEIIEQEFSKPETEEAAKETKEETKN